MDNLNELKKKETENQHNEQVQPGRLEHAAPVSDFEKLERQKLTSDEILVNKAMHVGKYQKNVNLTVEQADRTIHEGQFNMSEKDQKARYTYAKKKVGRFKLAQAHMRELNREREEEENDVTAESNAALRQMLKDFKKVSSGKFHYSDDTELCDNFEEEHKLLLEQIKNGKAAEKLYLTSENITAKEEKELLDMRARTEAFDMLRRFTELKIALISNPYYVVLTKEETAGMCDEEIDERMKEADEAKNASLARFFATLLALRRLPFNRSMSFADLKKNIRKNNTEKWKEERVRAVQKGSVKTKEDLLAEENNRRAAAQLQIEADVRAEMKARREALDGSRITEAQIDRTMKAVPDLIKKYRGKTEGWILDKYDKQLNSKLREAIKAGSITDITVDGGESLLRMVERYNRNAHASRALIETFLVSHPEITMCRQDREDEITAKLTELLGNSFFEREEEVSLLLKENTAELLKKYEDPELSARQKKISEAFPYYKYNKDFWKAVDASKLMDADTAETYLDLLKEKEAFFDSELKKIVSGFAPTCIEPVFDELKKSIGVGIFNCTLEQFYMKVEDELHDPLLYRKVVEDHRSDFELRLNNNKKVKDLFAHKEKGFLNMAARLLMQTDFHNLYVITDFMEKRGDLFLDVLKDNPTITEAVPQIKKFESAEDLAKLNYSDFMTCFNIVKANALPAAKMYNDFLAEEENSELQVRVLSRIMREQFDTLSFEKMVAEEKEMYAFEKKTDEVREKSALTGLLEPLQEKPISYSFMRVENAGRWNRDKFKLPARIKKLEQAHRYWQRIDDADCRAEMLELMNRQIEIEKLVGLSDSELQKNPLYKTFSQTVPNAEKRRAILNALKTVGKETKLASVLNEFRLLDFGAELLGAGGKNADALHVYSDREYANDMKAPYLVLHRALCTERTLAKFSKDERKLIFGNLKHAMADMIDLNTIEDDEKRLQAEQENVSRFGFKTYDELLDKLSANTPNNTLTDLKSDEAVADMQAAYKTRVETLKKEGDGMLVPILPYLLEKAEVREILNMGDNDDFDNLKNDILSTFMPFIIGTRQAGLSKFEIDQYLLDNFDSVYKNSAVNSRGSIMENMKPEDWTTQLKTFSDTLQNMKVPGQDKTLGQTLDEMNEYAEYKLGHMGRSLMLEIMTRDPMFMNKLIEDPKNYKNAVWKKMDLYKTNTAFIRREVKKYAEGAYKNDVNAISYFVSACFDDITSLKAAEFKVKWAERVDELMEKYDVLHTNAELEKSSEEADLGMARAAAGVENKIIAEIKKTKDEGLTADKDEQFLRTLEVERVENPYIFMAKDRVISDRKKAGKTVKRVKVKDSDVKKKEEILNEVLDKMLLFGKKLELPKYIKAFLCEAMLKDSSLKGSKLERHIRWVVRAAEELSKTTELTEEEKKQVEYDPAALEALKARKLDRAKKALLYLYINSKDHKIKELDQKKMADRILAQDHSLPVVDYGKTVIVDKDADKYGKMFEGAPLTGEQRKALDKEFKDNEKKILDEIKGLHNKKESAIDPLNVTESAAFKNFERVFDSIERLSKTEYGDAVLKNEIKEDIRSIQYGMYYMKPDDVIKLIENREKYYRTAEMVYEVAAKRLDENSKTADQTFSEKRYIMSGLREYLKKDIYQQTDEAFDENVWAGKIDSLLNNDMMRANITNAHGAVYWMDRYGDERTAYDEKTPDDVLIKLLKSGDKERIKKFKSLGAEEQQIFFAGLAGLKRVDFANGTTERFFENVPGSTAEAIILSKQLEEYVSGRQLTLSVDYGRSYYNLLKKNGKMDVKSFDAAFAFTEEIRRKREAGKPINMEKLGNAGNIVLEARNYGKPQWRELSRTYDDRDAFRKGLMDYLIKDTRKRNVTNMADMKTEMKDAIKENVNLEEIGTRLLSLSDSDYKLLAAVLKDRTILDYITVDVEEKMVEGKVIPHVNEAARRTLKDVYLANSDERTALISSTDNIQGYTAAMQTALSFQLKENISTDGVFKKSDFVESSIARSTLIDWKLIKNALNFVDELKNALARKTMVSKAPELIEQSGNEKAIAEYNKIKDKTEMSRSQFEEFIASQVESDEQAVFLGGYRALNDKQKALFIRALEHREILDISKKNLINNVILATDRDYVDPSARYALIDDYIEHSYGTKGSFTCSNETVLNAGKSLLSTQIADDLSTEDYRKKSIEELQSGERFFIARRNTAIDWKLFRRALQFVTRAENESEVKFQNDEMYRSMGNVKRDGRMNFGEKMLRRNIHTTGNRFVNHMTKDIRDNVKDYVPEGSALRFVLSKVLSVDNMNKVNELEYIPESDENQTAARIMEKQIALLEDNALAAVKKEFNDLTDDMRNAVTRAAVELMLTTGEIAVENVVKFIINHRAELLAAGTFILKATAAVGYGAYLGAKGIYNGAAYVGRKLEPAGRYIYKGAAYAAKYAAKYGYIGARYAAKYGYIGARYAAKYGYVGAKYAAKYGYIGAKHLVNDVVVPGAKFLYRDIAEPVGRFVYENRRYIYIGAKAAGRGVYRVGKYVLTSPPVKFVAKNGLKLAGGAAILAIKNFKTTVKLYKFAKANFDTFKYIKKEIGIIKDVGAKQELGKLYDAGDKAVMNEAKKNQSPAEMKLIDKGKERNAFMVNKGAFYLKTKYFDSIADSIGGVVSGGLELLGGVAGKAVGVTVHYAKEIIKLVAHYLRDDGALEDFYKGPGKHIAMGIKTTVLNSQEDKNKALAERFKNAADKMSDLKLVRLAQGYENEREHAQVLGLNIVHSILYSTSKYNPNVANRKLAIYVLKALNLDELAGRSDEASARKLYDALVTA